MLEVIIKQNERQIGQLQFDGNWKYEDAMKVLGIYIAREIPQDSEKTSETPVLAITKAPQQDIEEGPPSSTVNIEPETIQNDSDRDNVPLSASITSDGEPANSGRESEEFNLNPDDYHLIDRYAVGKKRVMKFKGENVTGNQIATLVALRDLGGSIKVANELAAALKRDARYDSQHVSGTYRMLLGALADFGWIDKAADDSKKINGLGRKIASIFPSLPRVEEIGFSDQSEHL